MVTIDKARGYNMDYCGLSTDTKPILGVGENSRFWELDTNDIYYFSNGAWQKIGTGGGGSGSNLVGSAIVGTAQAG